MIWKLLSEDESLAFSCSGRNRMGTLVWGIAEGKASFAASPPGSRTTWESAKSPGPLKARAHVLWRRALFHKALFF